MLRFLMSDDEPDDVYVDTAKLLGVELLQTNTWEEAHSILLEQFGSVDAIILDARGQVNQDSKKATKSHLQKAIEELGALKAEYKYLPPTIIFTGNKEELEDEYDNSDIVKGVFSKKENFEKVINFLKDQVEKNPPVVQLNKKVLSAFGPGLLEPKYRRVMYEFFESEIANSFGPEVLNNCRKILENILRLANKFEVFPDELDNHHKRLSYAKIHFTTNKDKCVDGISFYKNSSMNDLEKASLTYLIDVVNPGSHDNKIIPSNYSHKSAINALCVLILWIKEIEKNYR